ncbi:helix-turn-helix domain-containing protein [Microbacterium sp. NPDC076911]|uniref:helix-turn-helix transcriptional regulator n=1 Tax=Microbacterium sp. NPDC076911 TaxID=3154958 RepID=UPI0034494442
MDADDEWLTLPQAASLMRMTRAAIAQLRYRGGGPTFYRLSAKTILYKRSEIVSWMESRACSRTDDVFVSR